jgi:hypothetical protein
MVIGVVSLARLPPLSCGNIFEDVYKTQTLALGSEKERMTSSVAKAVWTPWAIVLLFVAPSKLVAHSVDHAIRLQSGALSTEREAELRTSFTAQFGSAVSLIRSSLFTAFFVVAGAIAAALLTAQVLQDQTIPKSQNWNVGLQFGGIGVLLWATLGRVESAIQTWDGVTVPERVDQWLYRFLYIAGSYALALSVVW